MYTLFTGPSNEVFVAYFQNCTQRRLCLQAAKTWRRRRASLLKGVMGGPEVTIDPNSNDVLELCLVVPRANRGPLDVSNFALVGVVALLPVS